MFDRGKVAFAVVEVVALVARLASSGVIERSALVGNRDANSVFIEDPVVRAFNANLLVPVPFSTAYIGYLLGGSELAFSVVEVVALVAGKTSSGAIEGVALVRYGDANVVFVEDPIVRALKANLLVPVPGSTADVRDLLNWGLSAFSILEVVSFIARLTGSGVIKSSTLVGNRDADSVLIEDPIVRALKANLFIPVPGSASYIRDLLDRC